MAWPSYPGSHPPASVQDEHSGPRSVPGVMQGTCHEGTASSAPATSPTSCSPLLAGPGWGWALGSHFHMALARNLGPALSWWEQGARCPGVHHCVRPGTRAGWQRVVSVPLSATHCRYQSPPYGDVPMAVPILCWRWSSVSTSGSHVGSQPLCLPQDSCAP